MNRALTLKKVNIGDIRIKKSASNFIYIQIFYVMIVFFLRDVLGLPSMITYITDVIMVLAFICCLKRVQKSMSAAQAKVQFYIICAIIFFVCVGAIANAADPLLFVWGARNNLRFFIFFLSCVVLLDFKDVSNIFKMLMVFFWLNVVVMTVEYFVFGLRQDYLGGLFGIAQGCNAYTNILLCFVLCYKVSQFFKAKTSLLNLALYVVAILYLAVLAELKIVYVEFLLILVVSLLINRPNYKTILIIILGTIGVALAIWLLSVYDPKTLEFFFESDQIEYYLSGGGYTNSGDLNRFTAIAQIQEMFFSGSWINTLFGFGLGSCDTSSFAFLQSDFFNQYEYLHYRWFSHAWVYLEQGAIGLILLVLFFVFILFYCIKHRRTNSNGYMLTAFLFTITTIIGIIYNCALELEASYLIAVVSAVPFIIIKSAKKDRVC